MSFVGPRWAVFAAESAEVIEIAIDWVPCGLFKGLPRNSFVLVVEMLFEMPFASENAPRLRTYSYLAVVARDLSSVFLLKVLLDWIKLGAE